MAISQRLLEDMDLLLDALARPAIALHRPYPQNNVPIGLSRFGGLPTLPDEVEWPVGPWRPHDSPGYRIAPLNFVAQVDCSEVHRYDDRLPEKGVLFFFAAIAGQQLFKWAGGPADGRDAAVVYCPDVAVGQPERRAPSNLPPVERYSLDRFELPDEPKGTAYPIAPMQVRRFQSYPDLLSVMSWEDQRPALELAWPDGHAPQSLAEAAIEDFRDAFLRRKAWREAASVVSAVESMPVDYTSSPGFRGDDHSCPAALHFNVRTIYNNFSRRLRPDQIELTRKVAAEAQEWLATAPIFSDRKLTEDERRDFDLWLKTVREGAGPIGYKLESPIREGLSAAAVCGYGQRYLGYRPLHGLISRTAHFPSKLPLHGEPDNPFITVHQMGGWFTSIQEPRPAGDPAIGLLSLFSDEGLEYMFHCGGHLQFWIEPEDLLARRFDRAWATIAGD